MINEKLIFSVNEYVSDGPIKMPFSFGKYMPAGRQVMNFEFCSFRVIKYFYVIIPALFAFYQRINQFDAFSHFVKIATILFVKGFP
jgi:hypothetical protein